MTFGPIPGSASSEPTSQSIGGVWVFTFASCPVVGSALAVGANTIAAQPIPTNALFLISFPSVEGFVDLGCDCGHCTQGRVVGHRSVVQGARGEGVSVDPGVSRADIVTARQIGRGYEQ